MLDTFQDKNNFLKQYVSYLEHIVDQKEDTIKSLSAKISALEKDRKLTDSDLHILKKDAYVNSLINKIVRLKQVNKSLRQNNVKQVS